MGGRPGAWGDERDRERTLGAQRDRYPIRPVIPDWEVDRRACRVVGRDRADKEVAAGTLAGNGQVAGDRGRVRGNAAGPTGDREGPGGVRAKGARQSRPVAGVQDACGRERVVRRA